MSPSCKTKVFVLLDPNHRNLEACPVCESSLSLQQQSAETCPQCYADLEVHRLLSHTQLRTQNMTSEKSRMTPFVVALGLQTLFLLASTSIFIYHMSSNGNQVLHLESQLHSLTQKAAQATQAPQPARVLSATNTDSLTPMLQQLLSMYQQERQERVEMGKQLNKLRQKLEQRDQVQISSLELHPRPPERRIESPREAQL